MTVPALNVPAAPARSGHSPGTFSDGAPAEEFAGLVSALVAAMPSPSTEHPPPAVGAGTEQGPVDSVPTSLATPPVPVTVVPCAPTAAADEPAPQPATLPVPVPAAVTATQLGRGASPVESPAAVPADVPAVQVLAPEPSGRPTGSNPVAPTPPTIEVIPAAPASPATESAGPADPQRSRPDAGKGPEALLGPVPAPAAVGGPTPVAAPAAPSGAGTQPALAGQLVPAIAAVHRRGVDGQHTLTVDVTPEELGPVRLTLEMRAGEVHLHLAGSSEASREALKAALPELRRLLDAAGMSAGALDVRPDDAGSPSAWGDLSGGLPRGGSDRGGATGSGPAARTGGSPAVADEPANAPSARPAHDLALDMRL
jgi:flagellar hook-length control protein FliK